MNLIKLGAALCLAGAIATASFAGGSDDSAILRVAHGGGVYGKQRNTSSIEALDASLANGFQLFEIDLNWTADSELVCIHDWEGAFKRFFGFAATEPPDLATFEYLVRHASELELCTLDTLMSWLKANPAATVVTDIKEQNVAALRLIAERYPDLRGRMIPQIYDPNEFAKVSRMGYERIIWTLYRYRGGVPLIHSKVGQMKGLYAVTMPVSTARKGLAGFLSQRGYRTYVHTVNSLQELAELREIGVGEIYTDTLMP